MVRYYRKMTYTKADVVKIVALIAIFSFLAYNGLSLWIFGSTTEVVKVQINTDYRPCDAILQCNLCSDKEGLTRSCRTEVDAVFQVARSKCRGYINNLQSCRNKRQGNCGIDVKNVEGCVIAVTQKVENKWWEIARGTSTS